MSLRILVITVHGIRTFGQWQRRLEAVTLAEANARGDTVTFKHKTYGYFSVFAFLNPLSRRAEVRRFSEELESLLSNQTDEVYDRVCLVGHSFGTHIIAHALQNLSDGLKKIDTVIFSGSVLRRLFPWPLLLGKRVVRLVNDCGLRDDILPLNAILPFGSGVAGRNGFDGIEDSKFSNRFFQFGHSGYFYRSKRRPDADDDNWFMKRYWVPLLLDAPLELADERRVTPFSGLVVGLVNRTEGFKWAVPVLLFSLVASLVLYQHAIKRNTLNAETSAEALRTGNAADPVAIKAAARTLLMQFRKVQVAERELLSRTESVLWHIAGYEPPSYRPPGLAAAAHRLAFNSRQLSTFSITGKMPNDADTALLRSWFNSAGHFIIEYGSGTNTVIDPVTGAMTGGAMYARLQPPAREAPQRDAGDGNDQSLRLTKRFPSELNRYVSLDNNRAILWDTANATILRQWTVPDGSGAFNYLLPFRERQAFVGITRSGQVSYFSPDGSVQPVADAATDFSLSNDDRFLAVASNSDATLLDTDKPAAKVVVPACGGSDDRVNLDVFSANGLYVLVGTTDGSKTCLFKVPAAGPLVDIWKDLQVTSAKVFAEADFILAVKDGDDTIGLDRTCLIAEASQSFDLDKARRWPCSGVTESLGQPLVRTSAEGNVIAMPGTGRIPEHEGIHLVDRRTGRTFRQMDEHENPLFSVAIDAAGDHVLSASRLMEEGNVVDKSTKLFLSDVTTPLFSTSKKSNDPQAVSFSADGSIFALLSIGRRSDVTSYTIDFFNTLQGTRASGGGLRRLPRSRWPGPIAGCPGWDSSSDKPVAVLMASAAAEIQKSPRTDGTCEVYADDRWIEFRKVVVEGKTFVVATGSDLRGRLAGIAIFDGGMKTIDTISAGSGANVAESLNDVSKGVATTIYQDGHVERRRYEDGTIIASMPCLCRNPERKLKILGIDHEPITGRLYVYAKEAEKTWLTVADRASLEVLDEFEIVGKIDTGGLYRSAVGASHSLQFTDFSKDTWIYVSSPGAKFSPGKASEEDQMQAPGDAEEIVIRNARTNKLQKLSCADKEGRVLSNDGYPTLRASGDGRLLATAHLGPGDGGYRADQSAVLWDVATGQCRGAVGDHSELMEFWFNRDGSLLVTFGRDETRVWHAPSMSLLTEYKGVVAGAVDQNGDLFLSADQRELAVAIKIPASDNEWISRLEALPQLPNTTLTLK